MAKGKKEPKQKEPSLRDKIKAYRRELHGEQAQTFDAAFIENCGVAKSKSLKEALQDGKDLQKAFVQAKAAAGPIKVKVVTDDDEDEGTMPATRFGKLIDETEEW